VIGVQQIKHYFLRNSGITDSNNERREVQELAEHTLVQTEFFIATAHFPPNPKLEDYHLPADRLLIKYVYKKLRCRRWSAKLVPTFADRGCRVGSATDSHGH
jgi:hypothetical protein